MIPIQTYVDISGPKFNGGFSTNAVGHDQMTTFEEGGRVFYRETDRYIPKPSTKCIITDLHCTAYLMTNAAFNVDIFVSCVYNSQNT
jgi:hypothetical protein